MTMRLRLFHSSGSLNKPCFRLAAKPSLRYENQLSALPIKTPPANIRTPILLGSNDSNVMSGIVRIATGKVLSSGNVTTRVFSACQPSHNNVVRSGHTQSGVRVMVSIRRSMVSLN